MWRGERTDRPVVVVGDTIEIDFYPWDFKEEYWIAPLPGINDEEETTLEEDFEDIFYEVLSEYIPIKRLAVRHCTQVSRNGMETKFSCDVTLETADGEIYEGCIRTTAYLVGGLTWEEGPIRGMEGELRRIT